MNELSMTLTSIVRQIVAGFFFVSGGILALALFRAVFHLGLCG